jgi:hypothetical protein
MADVEKLRFSDTPLLTHYESSGLATLLAGFKGFPQPVDFDLGALSIALAPKWSVLGARDEAQRRDGAKI